MAKIGIILSSWNRPNLITKTIESILKQSFTDWKLYIIENSHENIRKQVMNALSQYSDSRIKIIKIHDQYLQIGESYNLGLSLLEEEEYIMFASDDVILEPNKLKLLYNFLESNPDKSIVVGVLQVIEDGKSILNLGDFNCIPSGNCIINLAQPLIKRKVIDDIKGFNILSAWGAHPPDAELFGRISEKGYKIYSIRIPTDFTLKRHYGNYQLWLKSKRGELFE